MHIISSHRYSAACLGTCVLQMDRKTNGVMKRCYSWKKTEVAAQNTVGVIKKS